MHISFFLLRRYFLFFNLRLQTFDFLNLSLDFKLILTFQILLLIDLRGDVFDILIAVLYVLCSLFDEVQRLDVLISQILSFFICRCNFFSFWLDFHFIVSVFFIHSLIISLRLWHLNFEFPLHMLDNRTRPISFKVKDTIQMLNEISLLLKIDDPILVLSWYGCRFKRSHRISRLFLALFFLLQNVKIVQLERPFNNPNCICPCVWGAKRREYLLDVKRTA